MEIFTKHPIALDSNDHLKPHGAVHDRSDATEFCKYVNQHWPEKKTLLDLGTGNGTVVVSAVYQGFDAYGIEGSDVPRKRQEGTVGEPWNNYYNVRLFNADLRQEFSLVRSPRFSNDEPMIVERFDIITAWDVMEHMTEDTIDQVMTNIEMHAKPGTFVMATIQFDNHNNEMYHHLLKPREWWIAKFAEFGFKDQGPSPMLSLVRGVPEQCQFWFERI